MKQQILDELSTFLSDMERELSCCNETELRKRRLTSRIIRATLTLMLVLLAANSWYLYQLSTGLSDSLRMVDTMAEQFGRVTGSLSRVTGSVENISQQIVSLDNIDAEAVGAARETPGYRVVTRGAAAWLQQAATHRKARILAEIEVRHHFTHGVEIEQFGIDTVQTHRVAAAGGGVALCIGMKQI